MTPEERERLGRAWIETGLAEHASVAAFARFVLHLMSLGAPPDLLLEAIRAMGDEVHHARLCFGIARQFTSQPAGPGRMDLAGTFEQRDDPISILRGAILEGCFGETVSAQSARVALERTEDTNIRAALTRIVDDESRHAALSWRFVGWMLQQYPELTPVAEKCFASALDDFTEHNKEENDCPIFEKYGHLQSNSRREVQQATIHNVIIPQAVSLFGRYPISGGYSTEVTVESAIEGGTNLRLDNGTIRFSEPPRDFT